MWNKIGYNLFYVWKGLDVTRAWTLGATPAPRSPPPSPPRRRSTLCSPNSSPPAYIASRSIVFIAFEKNQWSGSGIQCFFNPWIWDPDPGSGMKIPDHFSESLETFVRVKNALIL